jgi:hypothetical protein
MKGTVLDACRRRRGRQIAPVVDQLQRCFRITHPFHPRRGESFDLIRYRRSWGHESVDGKGRGGVLVTAPLAWTDVAPEDPFVAMAKGRSWFRVEDLLRLVALLEGVEP